MPTHTFLPHKLDATASPWVEWAYLQVRDIHAKATGSAQAWGEEEGMPNALRDDGPAQWYTFLKK